MGRRARRRARRPPRRRLRGSSWRRWKPAGATARAVPDPAGRGHADHRRFDRRAGGGDRDRTQGGAAAGGHGRRERRAEIRRCLEQGQAGDRPERAARQHEAILRARGGRQGARHPLQPSGPGVPAGAGDQAGLPEDQHVRRFRPLLLLATIAFPGVAAPQTGGPPVPPRAITLQEAVVMARRSALVVIQARGQTRISAASTRAAYGAFLPALNLTAGATRQFASGARTRVENGQVVTLPSTPWSSNAGLAANVTIFSGGGRFFDLREARARESAAEVNETQAEWAAALNAEQQYYNVLAARESQTAAAAQLSQAEQQRRTAIARANARVATRSDSLRAEIQYRTAQVAVVDARVALDTANAALTRVTGSEEPLTAAEETNEHPGLAIDGAALRHPAL